jgi:tetratricopeptide (TPR) repeat protein
MKRRIKIPFPHFCIFLMCLTYFVNAQTDERRKVIVDSLNGVYTEMKQSKPSAKTDSLRIDVLTDLLAFDKSDQSKENYSKELLLVCERGLNASEAGPTLKKYFKHYLAQAHNNMAYFLKYKGNIPKALEHYANAIRYIEEAGTPGEVCKTYVNQAELYHAMGENEKSMDFLNKALKIAEENKDHAIMANIYNNMGSVVSDTDHERCLGYFQKALMYCEEVNDKRGIAAVLNKIGENFELHNNNAKALDHFQQCLKINEEIGNKRGKAKALYSIAHLYEKEKNKKQALEFALKSMSVCKELGHPEIISQTARLLKKIYQDMGDHKNALENFELFVKMRDSVVNENNRKASIRSQLKYEYEKQAAADSVAHAKESEIKSAELSRQSAEIKAKKNQQYALFGGLFLVMIFAGFMYNRFKITQKQKGVIESQKEIVEEQKKIVDEKQKEILDSIHYAKRIQLAQIPSEKRVHLILKRMQSPEVK